MAIAKTVGKVNSFFTTAPGAAGIQEGIVSYAAREASYANSILLDPKSLWGRSAVDIAAGFNSAGYSIHEGMYYKISTSNKGIIKVIDPETYKFIPDETATFINYTK